MLHIAFWRILLCQWGWGDYFSQIRLKFECAAAIGSYKHVKVGAFSFCRFFESFFFLSWHETLASTYLQAGTRLQVTPVSALWGFETGR